MLFAKFFTKDHLHFLAKAGKHLAAERYADARVDFLEAQSRCPVEARAESRQICEGLCLAGDRLAELNIEEGGHALNAGDLKKACDNFTLARELADDPKLRELADAGLKRVDDSQSAPPSAPSRSAHGGGSCGSCKDAGTPLGTLLEDEVEGVHEEDRFYLLVQTLPGELPARYCTLGGEFAHAYLLIHDGNDAEALPILQKMQVSSENDIVMYELALIMYRAGRIHECEELLNRALRLNPRNGACYLALVHLKADARSFAEALGIVNRMIGLGVLADQGQYMLGELHDASGNQAGALEAWSRALEIPSVAKPAAQRLIALLVSQGREAEAKFLAKKYVTGCC